MLTVKDYNFKNFPDSIKNDVLFDLKNTLNFLSSKIDMLHDLDYSKVKKVDYEEQMEKLKTLIKLRNNLVDCIKETDVKVITPQKIKEVREIKNYELKTIKRAVKSIFEFYELNPYTRPKTVSIGKYEEKNILGLVVKSPQSFFISGSLVFINVNGKKLTKSKEDLLIISNPKFKNALKQLSNKTDIYHLISNLNNLYFENKYWTKPENGISKLTGYGKTRLKAILNNLKLKNDQYHYKS